MISTFPAHVYLFGPSKLPCLHSRCVLSPCFETHLQAEELRERERQQKEKDDRERFEAEMKAKYEKEMQERLEKEKTAKEADTKPQKACRYSCFDPTQAMHPTTPPFFLGGGGGVSGIGWDSLSQVTSGGGGKYICVYFALLRCPCVLQQLIGCLKPLRLLPDCGYPLFSLFAAAWLAAGQSQSQTRRCTRSGNTS